MFSQELLLLPVEVSQTFGCNLDTVVICMVLEHVLNAWILSIKCWCILTTWNTQFNLYFSDFSWHRLLEFGIWARVLTTTSFKSSATSFSLLTDTTPLSQFLHNPIFRICSATSMTDSWGITEIPPLISRWIGKMETDWEISERHC